VKETEQERDFQLRIGVRLCCEETKQGRNESSGFGVWEFGFGVLSMFGLRACV
jgi:hypothetical protein